jgi:hypothetical protein
MDSRVKERMDFTDSLTAALARVSEPGAAPKRRDVDCMNVSNAIA